MAERITSLEKLTHREAKLLQLIRETQHGEMRLIIQDGHAIRIEDWKKSMKL
ncbi:MULTISPECIES: DUF2292 domain-containing protein [Tindallia]|uniref:Uncharacterized small protein n=2 Tax=Tindallia TaxID=69894 RepID=A0A1H3PAE4_9FIRM|nr:MULTISPECIES: DUF2292 domain-containing protein [Tindallia]SDY97795.1 Uncharacterized small protein [Tindallia californiensis]SFH82563.1 Uncharacterized small protein [Tindallia magadiensis]